MNPAPRRFYEEGAGRGLLEYAMVVTRWTWVWMLAVASCKADKTSSTASPAPSAIPTSVASEREDEDERRAFDDAFLAAGEPARPPGWQPAAGQAVVIHFVGTSYYGGKVLAVLPAKRKARIAWTGGSWADRDVPLREFVPEPTEPAAVKAGQFVLVRPEEPSQRWAHQRVVSVADDRVRVVDRDGELREVDRRDLIPMVAPRRP